MPLSCIIPIFIEVKHGKWLNFYENNYCDDINILFKAIF